MFVELAPDVTDVMTGKFCRLLAPVSASQASLAVTPSLFKSIPMPPLEKMKLPRILWPVPSATHTPPPASIEPDDVPFSGTRSAEQTGSSTREGESHSVSRVGDRQRARDVGADPVALDRVALRAVSDEDSGPIAGNQVAGAGA